MTGHCDECNKANGIVSVEDDLRAEIERLKAELAGETLPRESCHWTEDSDGNWWTECGKGFVFGVGGPKENSMRYCCYCGRKLQEVLFVEPQSGKEE